MPEPPRSRERLRERLLHQILGIWSVAGYDKTGLLIMAGTGTAGVARPRADGLVGTAHGYRE
jgi:hypothetical protein